MFPPLDTSGTAGALPPGLCFNYDEPYVRGHVYQHLFYLESTDFVDDDIPAEVTAAVIF